MDTDTPATAVPNTGRQGGDHRLADTSWCCVDSLSPVSSARTRSCATSTTINSSARWAAPAACSIGSPPTTRPDCLPRPALRRTVHEHHREVAATRGSVVPAAGVVPPCQPARALSRPGPPCRLPTGHRHRRVRRGRRPDRRPVQRRLHRRQPGDLLPAAGRHRPDPDLHPSPLWLPAVGDALDPPRRQPARDRRAGQRTSGTGAFKA